VSLGKAPIGITSISIFEWLRLVTGDSLTQKPKRSLRCLLAETTWQINEQNCKKKHLLIFSTPPALIYPCPPKYFSFFFNFKGEASNAAKETKIEPRLQQILNTV